MNGKISTMLRQMNSNSKKDKRIWNSLTKNEKGKVRRYFKVNKIDHPSLQTVLEAIK